MVLALGDVTGGKLVLTRDEREAAKILVVEPNNSLRSSLRNMLMQSGFNNIASVSDYSKAVSKLNDDDYTHVIFDVNNAHIPPIDFLQTVRNMNPSVHAIPASETPSVDDVFDLLLAGAGSYLVKPYNTNAINDSICFASKGEPIANNIGDAKDRDEALIRMVLLSLNKLTLVLKQARRFKTARREVPRKIRAFKHAVRMANQFTTGSPLKFRDLLVDYLIEKAENENLQESKLSVRKRARMRKRRRRDREESADDNE